VPFVLTIFDIGCIRLTQRYEALQVIPGYHWSKRLQRAANFWFWISVVANLQATWQHPDA
jgi:hypothetical protein